MFRNINDNLEEGENPMRVFFDKIFDYNSDQFLRIKNGKYYVFQNHIVFRKKGDIYAIPHFRKGELSVVDSFEEEYSNLGLKYEFSGDLGRGDIKKINQRLDNFGK